MGAFLPDTSATLNTNLLFGQDFEGDADDNVGTRTATTATALTFSSGNGKVAQGVGANASTSQIIMSSSFTQATTGSISFWIKYSDTNSDFVLFNFYNGTIGQNLFGLFNAGTQFGFFPHNSSSGAGFRGFSASDTNTLLDGNWHHVVITFTSTASSSAFYLDGVSKSTSQLDGYTTNPRIEGTLYFFKRGGDGLGGIYGGAMDDFYVWDKVLSSQEITDLYNSGSGNTWSSATNITVSSTVLSATFSAPSRTVSGGATVSPAVQAATFSSPARTVSGAANVSPSVLSATFSHPVANIITPDSLVSASVVSATFSTPTTTVSGASNVSVGVLSATFSVPAFTVPIGYSHAAGVLSATFSTQAPVITAIGNITVSPSALSATFTTLAPTISAEVNAVVSANVLTAVFTTQAPTITAQRHVTISATTLSATFSTPARRKVGGVWSPQPRTEGVWTRQPRVMG